MQTELRFLRPVTKTEEHRFQKMKNFYCNVVKNRFYYDAHQTLEADFCECNTKKASGVVYFYGLFKNIMEIHTHLRPE